MQALPDIIDELNPFQAIGILAGLVASYALHHLADVLLGVELSRDPGQPRRWPERGRLVRRRLLVLSRRLRRRLRCHLEWVGGPRRIPRLQSCSGVEGGCLNSGWATGSCGAWSAESVVTWVDSGRKYVEGFARAPYRSVEKLGWWLMQCSQLRVKLLKLRPRHILARRADVLESIR